MADAVVWILVHLQCNNCCWLTLRLRYLVRCERVRAFPHSDTFWNLVGPTPDGHQELKTISPLRCIVCELKGHWQLQFWNTAFLFGVPARSWHYCRIQIPLHFMQPFRIAQGPTPTIHWLMNSASKLILVLIYWKQLNCSTKSPHQVLKYTLGWHLTSSRTALWFRIAFHHQTDG